MLISLTKQVLFLYEPLLTMNYGPFRFSGGHIRQRARACRVVEGGSFKDSLKKILKGRDKK
jgi:hypothetical protein